jgi:CheY-like chemotaxis protein
MVGAMGGPSSEVESSVLIVVVEDNDDDARLTTRALKQLSPRPLITLVEDGAKAIELLTGPEALKPDLILLDLKLPKVNGLEVLKEVKEDKIVGATPVIVLTSSDEPSDVSRARELGCVEYLCKPVDWREYLSLVSETVTRCLPS